MRKVNLSIDTKSCVQETFSTQSPDKICCDTEEPKILPVPMERFNPNGLEIIFY